MTRPLPPMHPGEVLREEFLAPLHMSAGALAKRLGVPRSRIERIAEETVGITADTALRLGKYFRMSAQFWLNLQSDYDVQMASKSIAKDLNKIKPIEQENSASAPSLMQA